MAWWWGRHFLTTQYAITVHIEILEARRATATGSTTESTAASSASAVRLLVTI
jgi:hypothetical protein